MKYELNNETLTIFFEGEFNSSNAQEIGEEATKIASENKFEKLILDFDNVTFISSAGLRVVLSLKQKYPNTSLINANLQVYDILQMTGFTSMMSVSKALRKIELGNAEVIGDGFFSTVYRLNKDTIVKVFNRTSDPGQVERELKLAKEAFVLGIPTAISFDVVRVGEKLGVCFEMLDCMSLKTAILTHRKNYKEYLKEYANLLKKINTTECLNPAIPDIKKNYLEKVKYIEPFLDKKYFEKAKKLVTNIPDRKTFVHGDCHFKNIMVQNGELLLIDMDTLSVGHPIFELVVNFLTTHFVLHLVVHLRHLTDFAILLFVFVNLLLYLLRVHMEIRKNYRLQKLKQYIKFYACFLLYTFKYFLIEITLPRAPIPIPNSIYTNMIELNISAKLIRLILITCINCEFTNCSAKKL